MPKYKNISKKEMKAESDIYTIRPVTKQDKWCRFHSDLARKMNDEAPFGYVVTIPKWYHKLGFMFKGKVLRTKLYKKTLYLQVSASRRDIVDEIGYFLNIDTRQVIKKNGKKKSKKSTSRVLNVRNSYKDLIRRSNNSTLKSLKKR